MVDAVFLIQILYFYDTSCRRNTMVIHFEYAHDTESVCQFGFQNKGD